jgi:hypothetical protein
MKEREQVKIIIPDAWKCQERVYEGISLKIVMPIAMKITS